MTPYAIALLARLASYTGWLAIAVTCHPIVSLGRRTRLTRGALWSIALAGIFTTTSVAVEAWAAHSGDLPATGPDLHSLMRWLSWIWLMMIWVGVSLVTLRPDHTAARLWARRTLALGVVCGTCVCVMRLTLAAITKAPW